LSKNCCIEALNFRLNANLVIIKAQDLLMSQLRINESLARDPHKSPSLSGESLVVSIMNYLGAG
jgi:hypothetical protein